MAHYQNLPIFKAAYDVALHFEKVVGKQSDKLNNIQGHTNENPLWNIKF